MMDVSERQTVLIVDDDDDLRASIVQMLTLADHEVLQATEGKEALAIVEAGFQGPVISDVRMPRMDGLELLAALQRLDPERPVILLTGHGDVEMAVAALHDGAWDFLTKPFDPEALVAAVTRAGEKRRLVLENRALRALVDNAAHRSPIIGNAVATENLRRTLAALARTPIDLIIEGESGTGKELAARTLHAASPGRGRFVAIASGAISDHLLDDGLFSATGPIAEAEDGTLFLDDLHKASPAFQARLTEFAETRVLGRLASKNAHGLRCRIIATIPGRSVLGDIDDPLIYRLSGMHVRIAPLRERVDDIPPLLIHCLAEAARTLGRETLTPGHAVLQWAMSHGWPGNVREMQRFAERLTLGLDENAGDDTDLRPLPDRVDAFERAQIVNALKMTDGNVAAAVDLLGVARKTLYYKFNKLGLDPAMFRKDVS